MDHEARLGPLVSGAELYQRGSDSCKFLSCHFIFLPLNKPQSLVLGDSLLQTFLSFVAFWSLSIVAVLPIQRSLSDLCTN